MTLSFIPENRVLDRGTHQPYAKSGDRISFVIYNMTEVSGVLKDYQIPALIDLINCLNLKHQNNDIWARRYLALHSVVYYFEYAAGMVQIEEKALSEKLPDPIICGAGVSAYANMGACLKLLNKALSNFTDPILQKTIKNYSTKIERINNIRDRITAHPYEEKKAIHENEKFLISKRSGYSSDGRIWIRQISYEPTLQSKSNKFELAPRIDLENLRSYLSEVATVLLSLWC